MKVSHAVSLLAAALATLSGSLLLLLVERLAEDVKELLVFDLLVALDLLEVKGRRATDARKTVLGDGDGGEQPADGLGVGSADDLVLTDDVTTDTLDDADLAGALVVELAQAEGESAELVLNLGKSGAGAGALQAVCVVKLPVKGGAVREVLDLAVAGSDTHLDTPDLANLGHTVTPDTVAGCEDDLLVALDVVAVELPDGSVLNEVALVGLRQSLEELGDLSLGVGLGGGRGLLLLLFGAGGQETGRDHGAEDELLGVVRSQLQVGGAAGDLAANNDSIANNCAKAVDLGAELNLHRLAGLQGDLGLLSIGDQRSVGSNERAGRNGAGVGNALGDLLALVDLGDLLLEELVALLADLDDLGALSAPSYRMSQSRKEDRQRSYSRIVPETVLRTFSEMVAAVLYLVRLNTRSMSRHVWRGR